MRETRQDGEALGVYLSVPFCRAKCSFCNFASGVFGGRMPEYVAKLVEEIKQGRERARGLGAELPGRVDSVYLGGGTPSLLDAGQVREIFAALRGEFDVEAGAEITVECAPGQIAGETLEELLRQGMDRVSFGVQSFVDAECSAVGRTHTGASCVAEIGRMRAAGVGNVGVDVILGLPHQTGESVDFSVRTAVESGVEHVSVYLLEVDEDSRLGREVMAGGTRYGAGALPSEDAGAEWYERACAGLAAGGVEQYEISNFARAGFRSRHNLKYWRREAYLGFGMDAHSMLRLGGVGEVRFANAGEMDGYLGFAGGGEVEVVGRQEAFEEALFLGLRVAEGVDLSVLREEFGAGRVDGVAGALGEAVEAGLMERGGEVVRLTGRGRLASNEVFGRLVGVGV